MIVETEKRLRLDSTDRSLNRLSKLQKLLLCSAYQIYADKPRLSAADMDFSPWPPLSFSDVRAGLAEDPTRPHHTPHLFTPEAIAVYLGIAPEIWKRWERLDRGQWFYRGQWSSRSWRSAYVDHKQYATAHAAVCRSFSRLMQRDLVRHYHRAVFDNSAIRLTYSGIDLGWRLTNIQPKARSWETIK